MKKPTAGCAVGFFMYLNSEEAVELFLGYCVT